MPTFEITSPEGKAYTVDGPDGTTPQQAYQVLQKYLAGGGLGAAKQTNASPQSAATTQDPSAPPPGYVLDKPQGNYFDQFDPKGNYFDQFDGKEASPQKKTIAVTAPNGATVEFPEGTDYATINSVMAQNFHSGPPAGYVLDKPQGSTLGGIAKSIGTGLVNGALGIAGIPAELAHLYAPNQNDPNPLGIAGLQAKAAPYLHTPQGALEETAAKIGEFAPAVIGGPETLGAKIATRAVAPAVASELAGKATEGTALQPWAEAAGALAGGIGAPAAMSKLAELGAARAASKALPSGEALLQQGSNQFQAARGMDIAVKPDFAKSTAADMRSALKDYDPEDSGVKDVFRKINRIDDLAAVPAGSAPRYNALIPANPVPMNEIENVRKQLSELRMSPDPTTRAAAKTALEKLTERQQALSPADVVSGDANAYASTMREAVGNYGAGKRSLVVRGKQDLADLNAGTAGSGANVDNATRQAIKQLARPINNTNVPVAKRLGFNDAEIEAIKNAATGTTIGNAARYLGKAAPTGIVSAAMAGGAGHLAGGPIGAVALPAAGYIAKKIGDLSTKRAVAALDAMVRSRSPLAAQVAVQLPPRVVQQLPKKSAAILAASQLGAAVRQQQQGNR
jgi:hypothetical protein